MFSFGTLLRKWRTERKRRHSRLLCQTFAGLAEKVWKDLRDAYSAGLVRDEETITNDLMLSLWRLHPAEVIVYQFSGGNLDIQKAPNFGIVARISRIGEQGT